ncbi:MAG: hypothetical protein QOI78_3138, partial [Actinomycetota bacterium]|nr:hypothetical protein [Actinomycetota bacterium]
GDLAAWMSAKPSTAHGASIASFQWDFDGDHKPDATCPGDAPAAYHQFTGTGNQSVSMTAVDTMGGRDTTTQSVAVAHVKTTRATRVPAGSARRRTAARRRHSATLCITQPLDGQQPSSADCVRSLQWGVVDVNVRSSRCFSVETFTWSIHSGKTVTHPARAALTLPPARVPAGQGLVPAEFMHATVQGPVQLNGLPVPVPGQFTSDYDTLEDTIKLGTREIGFDLGGRHVSLGKLDLNTTIPGTTKHRVAEVNLANMPLLGGLGVEGAASVDFVSPGESRLNAQVRLPKFFSMGDAEPAYMRVQFAASNTAPFRLENAHTHLSQTLLGPVLVQDLDLDYQAQGDRWEGGFLVRLFNNDEFPFLDVRPPPLGKGGPGAGIGIAGGEFSHAGADLSLGSFSFQIFPAVFLTHINFSISTHPLVLTGGITLNTAKIVNVRGGLLAALATPEEPYKVPDQPQNEGLNRLKGQTFTDLALAAGGDVSFDTGIAGLEVPLGAAYLLYQPGRISFDGHVDVPLGIFSITGGASGFFDFNSRRFNLEGGGQFCVDELGCLLGAHLLVSSDGIAGCASLTFVDAGLGYRWGDTFPDIMFYGCDVAPYRVHASAAHAAANGFTVSSGLPFASLKIKGTADAPAFTLRGPKGESFSTGAARSQVGPSFSYVRVDKAHTTYVGLKRPSAGNWTLTAAPGSTIANFSLADGLPAPSIKARVSGTGAARTLRYAVKPQPGLQVTFAEQGSDAYREIGKAKGASGKLRFRPAFGRGGTRKVVALVSHNGVASRKLDVTSFRIRRPGRPGRPRVVRVRRRGTSLLVSWGRATGAVRYAVTLKTNDGARRFVVTRKHKVTLRGVEAFLRGTVEVSGLRFDNVLGRAGRARLKAKA